VSSRRRNLLILLLFSGLLIASALVVITRPTQLGLDLQGGIELTLQGRPTPQVQEVTGEDMDRAVDLIRAGCDSLGVAEIEVSRLGQDQISVGIPGARSLGKATECATTPARLFFYDWQNNLVGPARELDTRLNFGAQPDREIRKKQRDKWNEAGRPSTQGFNRQLIEEGAEPTVWDAVQIAKKEERQDKCPDCAAGDKYYLFTDDEKHELLSGPVADRADLYFDSDGAPIPEEGTIVQKVPQGTAVVAELPTDPATGRTIDDPDQAGYFVIKDRAELTGSEIKDPNQETDPVTNQPNVTFKFSGGGREAFQEITRRIAQEGQARALGAVDSNQASGLSGNFAIVLDNQVVSRPIINFVDNPDGIDGRTGAQITGGFTIGEAQNLAQFLQRGALPIELVLTSQSQVSATLGQEALDQSVRALGAGLILVVLFLLIFYRFLGAVASAALISYGLIFLALVKLIPITLTLPGIAGLVLTIGVAADSNIVIFERIKEELRAGRPVGKAISIGYRRGISTIIDANVVTLLTAFILFLLATSGIKGFAFTLGVGTLTSLLTAVVFTQALLGSISNTEFMRSGKALGNVKGKPPRMFDFTGKAKWVFAASGIVLLIGGGALALKGLNFGIDFESGTKIEFALEKPATTEEVRSTVAEFGLGSAAIQEVKNQALGENVFQIQSETLRPDQVEEVQAALEKDLGLATDKAATTGADEAFNSVSVGPTFGASVVRSAVLAMIFSLLLISAYLAVRFQPKYIVPVLIAISHDILIALGVYALLGFEVSSATVAAFLTILGYSLYDTIIVFDRIRENQEKMPRATYSQIVNQSTSEVVTRSLATSFSTLVPVVALLVFGGETLSAFAIAILVGVSSGVYSSLFIASPVLALWKEREPTFRRRRRQQIEIQGYSPAFAHEIEAAKVEDGSDAPAGEASDAKSGTTEGRG
jgi:SecD/SecF fusion protein